MQLIFPSEGVPHKILKINNTNQKYPQLLYFIILFEDIIDGGVGGNGEYSGVVLFIFIFIRRQGGKINCTKKQFNTNI